MRPTSQALSTVTAVALLSAGMTAAHADVAEQCPSTLRLADTGIEGAEELRRAFGPFAEQFSEITGVNMEFFAVSNRTAAANALRYDSIDLALAGPSEYVVMSSEADIDVAFGLERDAYGAKIVANANLGAEDIEDLRGTTLAFGDVGSTTNHITQGWMIEDAGLSLDRDLDTIHAGDARIQALVNGDVDAAALGYRDLDLIPEYDADFDYDVVADSGTMPRDPMVARAELGEGCIAAIRDTVQEHEEELFSAFVEPGKDEGFNEAQERAKYLGARFVYDISDDEYDMVREAYDYLGFDL